jgi:hypothetical protein
MWAAILALFLFTSGTASAQNFQVSPSEKLEFIGVPGTTSMQILKIENLVDQDLTIMTKSYADPSFMFKLPPQIVLKAKGALEIPITYIPNAATAEGYIVFTEGNSTVRVALIGSTQGSTDGSLQFPEYVTFGPVPQTKSECQGIEFANLTKSAVRIDYALAGYSKDWNIPTDNVHTLTLEAGAKGSINVCFEPLGEFDSKEELILKYSFDDGVTYQKASTWLLGMIEREVDPKTPCLSTNERVGIGPVLYGQSSQGAIYLSNQTEKPIVITNAQLSGPDASSFALNIAFPITINAFSKNEIAVTFTPRDEQQMQYSAELLLSLQSELENCDRASVQLYGWTTEKVTKDSRIPIFTDGRKAIGVEWLPGTMMQKVVFYNNLDHEIEVKEVKLRDGIDFRIVESSPTVPAMLKPDESIIIVLATGADQKTYFTDAIIFVTSEVAAGEQGYDLQGMMQSASVSESGNSEIELSVGPNPMTNQLNVSVRNAARANISIFDIEGKMIASSNAQGVTWTPASQSAGSYFVRVTGTTTTGKPFNITRRVIAE